MVLCSFALSAIFAILRHRAAVCDPIKWAGSTLCSSHINGGLYESDTSGYGSSHTRGR